LPAQTHRVFTSHIVQIKQDLIREYLPEDPNFTSHIVQIKLDGGPHEWAKDHFFTSHIVQIKPPPQASSIAQEPTLHPT